MGDGPNPETTAHLLALVRAGDADARERLVARYLPVLRAWARGRLPHTARAAAETDDMVQVAILKALAHVDRFEARREGAFLAYLRQILLNTIRDETRRAVDAREASRVSESFPHDGPSVLEQTIGRQLLEEYETALATLSAVQQEAVILRVEFGYSHQEIADAIGSPSANAARMTVSRAFVTLADKLGPHRHDGP